MKAIRQGGISNKGEYLLHGKQAWYYEPGQIKWEFTCEAGRKTGREIFRNPDGRKVWERFHKVDGSIVWTQYWPNGREKAQSNWRGTKAEGKAKRWDREGNLISDVEFWNGRIL